MKEEDAKFIEALKKILDEHSLLGREALAFLVLKKWIEALPERLNPPPKKKAPLKKKEEDK